MQEHRTEPIDMTSREYSIGDAAKASGLTVKTIRYYEAIGLIPKAARHNSGAHTGGNRVYSEADVGRLAEDAVASAKGC